MPELPDLQVFSANLQDQFKGKKLLRLVLVNKKKGKTSEAALRKSLEGQRVSEVFREGKELHFRFSNKHILGLHLMLRGDLYVFDTTNDHKFTILELHFHDGSGLAMTDFQGQANATLDPLIRDSPDAMSSEVDFSFLKEKFTKSKAAVKNVLLDQDFVRGIGNAYADEILWDCRISPFSACHKIPDNKIKALAKSIKTVLKNAERQIRKTNPHIITGEVRDFLPIHNAKRKESPDGGQILVKAVGGRKTYYTEEQELFL